MSRKSTVFLILAMLLVASCTLSPEEAPLPPVTSTATQIINMSRARVTPTFTPWPKRWYDETLVSSSDECVLEGNLLVCTVRRHGDRFVTPSLYTLPAEIERLTGYPVTRQSDLAVIVQPDAGRTCGTTNHPTTCPGYEYWADAPSVVFRAQFGWSTLTMDDVILTIGPRCAVFTKAQALGLTGTSFDNLKDEFIRGMSAPMPDGSYRVALQGYGLSPAELSVGFGPFTVVKVDPVNTAIDFRSLNTPPDCQ